MKGDFRIAGFDCGEDEHRAVLLSTDGEVERAIEVVNRREEIERVLAQLMVAIGPSWQLAVVVESKRSHGRIVADVAQALGCRVWQVNTVALDHFRDLEGQPRKDDEWDAYLAGRMAFLRMRGCRLVVGSTDEERALSRLTRAYGRLTKDHTQAVSRLRASLLELVPEMLHNAWEGPKVDSKAVLYLLERWPGFEGLERAQLRSIEGILHTCRYGTRAPGVAKQLREMARRIEVEPEERAAFAMEISLLVRQIHECKESMDRLHTEITERVQRHPVGAKLVEMRGIGPVIAGVLVSELLPVARTSTEPKCATYSGVTPLARKSGKSLDNDRLAQGVNKHVLHALYTSSVVAIKHSPIDRAYYNKKLRGYQAHPKPHVAAFIALSRQRHKLIYKLMTTATRYDTDTLVASHLDRIEQNRVEAA